MHTGPKNPWFAGVMCVLDTENLHGIFTYIFCLGWFPLPTCFSLIPPAPLSYCALSPPPHSLCSIVFPPPPVKCLFLKLWWSSSSPLASPTFSLSWCAHWTVRGSDLHSKENMQRLSFWAWVMLLNVFQLHLFSYEFTHFTFSLELNKISPCVCPTSLLLCCLLVDI